MSNPKQKWLTRLLERVFRAGVGFERGESMMEHGHLKTTPEAAAAAINAKFEEAVGLSATCLNDGRCAVAKQLDGDHINSCPLNAENLKRLKGAVQAWYNPPAEAVEGRE